MGKTFEKHLLPDKTAVDAKDRDWLNDCLSETDGEVQKSFALIGLLKEKRWKVTTSLQS